MTRHNPGIFAFLLLLALGGCATVPMSPSVMVLPAPGKPFGQFRAEDASCRQWAAQAVGQPSQKTVRQNTATGALVGTAIGTGLGAALGAASGHVGTGAAIGAGSGLLIGALTGADAGKAYGWDAQQRYDNAYMQCMYAKGNQIPGVAAPASRSRRVPLPPPPPPDYNPDQPAYQAPPPPR